MSEIKIEDYYGRFMKIFIDDEVIYEDRPDPMAIINSFADYMEMDVDWEMKDLPEQQEQPNPEDIMLDDNNSGNENGEGSQKVDIQYENEICDGSEDYETDLDE